MERKREAVTLAVHRCRFIDYAPSAITALAFPPLPLPSVKGKKKAHGGQRPFIFGLIAVGHANGNIDISEWTGKGQVQSSQAWVVRKTLPGLYPSKVDSLVFAIRHPDHLGPDDVPTQSQLRLFSSGGGTDLLEWDIDRGCIRRTISSQGGSIWSIAVNPSCSSLALGCEDGTVRILSVANDTLTHSRRFDRVKCRMLSIAWGPPVPRQTGQKLLNSFSNAGVNESSDSDEDDEDEWTDSWLVTGGSDSSLRKWDVSTGRVIDRMGVQKVRGERTLVWTVGVLGDGTIVSGDSLGMVKFWDSRTCTQLSSFQAHGADVLCMTIGPDGKFLYTSGVDQKTVQFSLVKTSSSPRSHWTQAASKRMHSHDVRALAIWPPYTPLPGSYKRQFPLDIAPVLASGGLDMSLVLSPAAPPTSTVMKVVNPLDTSVEATFEDSYHRRVSYPITGKVRVARGARLISCVREAGLSVWRIPKKSDKKVLEEPHDHVGEESCSGAWEKVLEMDFNVHSNIIAHEISDDGRWLVVSDLFETKLFSLHTDKTGQFHIKRIKDFATMLQSLIPSSTSRPPSTGSSSLRFTPDSSKLVLCTAVSSYVNVVDLAGEKPKVLRQFGHHRIKDLSKSGRVLRGRLAAAIVRKEANKDRLKVNEHITVNGDDVEMDEPGSPTGSVVPNGLEESDDSEMEEDQNDSTDSDEEEDEEDNIAIVSIDRIAISADGQWLATSDSLSRTHIFNLDSVSHHTTLPTFPSPVRCLAFDPMRPSILLLVFPDHSVQIYDVEVRQFPEWGKDLAATLPRKFRNSHEAVVGAEFDPYEPTGTGEEGRTRYILFWGSTWILKANLDTRPFLPSNKKKRRRRGEEEADDATTHGRPVEGGNEGEEERQWRDFKMITQYRPTLCCDFLSKAELVVVERPSVDVLMTLPPAYFRHKYGS